MNYVLEEKNEQRNKKKILVFECRIQFWIKYFNSILKQTQNLKKSFANKKISALNSCCNNEWNNTTIDYMVDVGAVVEH